MSAQAEALEKAIELLGEHFDDFLIVTLTDRSEIEAGAEAIRVEVGKSPTTAIGLLCRAQGELLYGGGTDRDGSEFLKP